MNTINTDTLINFLLSQKQQEKTIELELLAILFYDHIKIHNRKGTLKSYKCNLIDLFNYLNTLLKLSILLFIVISTLIVDRE